MYVALYYAFYIILCQSSDTPNNYILLPVHMQSVLVNPTLSTMMLMYYTSVVTLIGILTY